MNTHVDIVKIWNEYHINLSKFVINRINETEDASDIIHDIFLKIQKGLSGLESDKKIHSWIFTIARNAVIDYYRKKKSKTITVEFLPEVIDVQGPGAEEEISRCLLPMVAKLPAIYRETLILSQFRSMTNREVVAKLGISVSGVKSRVQRGRFLLKEMLLDCCNFELDSKRRIVDYEPKYKRK